MGGVGASGLVDELWFGGDGTQRASDPLVRRISKIDNLCQSCHFDDGGIPMATMNVSLPDAMKDWVEGRAETGRYSNASDYVRDLIRRDQERAQKIAHLQHLIDEGGESCVSEMTVQDIRAEARRRAGVGHEL